MKLWTQRLTIAWRPTLGFFEHRYEVLRELERRELLQGFRVDEQRVAIRLRDASHVVAFAPGRLEVSLLRPDPDLSRVEEALELLVPRLELGAARISLAAHWLQPLEMSYADARGKALHRVFPDLPAAESEDFAFMIENKHGRDVRWTLDAGVVEQDELPPRLSSHQSRISPPDPETPPTLWPPESLPKVALFCDSTFDLHQRVENPTLDSLTKSWQSVAATAEEVVGLVFARLDPRVEE